MTSSELFGPALEAFGLDVLNGLGLGAIGPLLQAPLKDLDPGGPYAKGEHLEMDYLVPSGSVCLVGEITARSDPKQLKEKYQRFCRQLGFLSRIAMGPPQWQTMGVPAPRIRELAGVTRLVGFFIATRLEDFDVDLDVVPGVAMMFRKDWSLLCAYKECLGPYAKPYFVSRLGGQQPITQMSLSVSRDLHGLMQINDRQVASGAFPSAVVYTFAANPYDLLPMASVFRRDLLPDLSSNHGREYQRPLIPHKLTGIRSILTSTPDFMFPTSILAVLSPRCQFLPTDGGTLVIPGSYGAIEIIDGQHRLFSYAAADVEAIHRPHGRVIVTAIDVRAQDQASRTNACARTFVEVNSTQTRIPTSHVLAIGYSVLGDTSPRSLGAEVLLRLNIRKGPTRGLFSTSQTGLGIIKATTVLTAVHPLTNLTRLRKRASRKGKGGDRIRRGYSALLSIDDMGIITPEDLLERVTEGTAQYLNRVKTVFKHDWPTHSRTGSSLGFAKVFAAVLRLFGVMIREGKDWSEVQSTLTTLRDNMLRVRKLKTYRRVLFDPTASGMPTSGHSIKQDFKFLEANRTQPTPIQHLVTKRKRP